MPNKTIKQKKDRKINVVSLEDLLMELIYAIRDLKEQGCQNSGHNWFEEIFEGKKDLEIVTSKRNK